MNLLKERFENKTLAIRNHVKALFSLPAVSKEYSLRNLLDDFQKRYRALEILGEPVEHWSTLLIHLITNKLANRSLAQWEESVIHKKLTSPKLADLISSLSDRFKLLKNTDNQYTKSVEGKSGIFENKQVQKRKSFHAGLSRSTNIECFFCKENHPIYNCKKLIELPVTSRVKEINKLKLCANCLRNNHTAENCKAQGCKVCSKKHSMLLHIENKYANETNENNRIVVVTSENSEPNEIVRDNAKVTSVSVYHSRDSNLEILLPTAVVLIQDANGEWKPCRALLDSASQSNFITKNLVDKIKLSCSRVNVPIVGIGNHENSISQRVHARIKSSNDSYDNEISLLVLDVITERLPNLNLKKSDLNLPRDIELADKSFNVSGSIDILLGASIFYEVLQPEQRRLGTDLPILQKTVFGWILAGQLPLTPWYKPVRCHLSLNNSIEGQLERFWQIEEQPSKTFFTPEETSCQKIFNETLKHGEDGRFVVTLPLRDNSKLIGDSVENAVKRLRSIERKFQRNPEFGRQYVNFMREYEQLGHMRKIEPKDIELPNTGRNLFYLPHHGVINENSSTTALRVVFDASCLSSTGVALNDILMIGPSVQDELFAILIRFRQHKIVITADVAKMYRQVRIADDQKDLQRIVWRENSKEEISHYQLVTVTYGTAPASFLATRALQQAAVENRDTYPKACEIILNDFYVDDLITGVNNIYEGIQLKNEISQILNQYGFILRKWASNSKEVINFDNSVDKYYIHEGEIKKTLGLVWHANTDVLTYTVKKFKEVENTITKRMILSTISSVFDRLGLIAPVIIRAKVFIQRLWQAKMGWDDPVGVDIYNEWLSLVNELPLLNSFKIERHAIVPNATRIELHCFSDASQIAYGACIYLRSTDGTGTVYTQLLCAKSRVAPLKTLSIPRLELCGALLSTNLYEKVQQALRVKVDAIHFWTDSTIVLGWLSMSPSNLKIFVAHRISEIQSKTAREQWQHIPTESNPADLVSRGKKIAELQTSELWWLGPNWLRDADTSLWPCQLKNISTDIPEVKNTKFTLRFSSLFKLIRVVTYCFRFYLNCKRTTKRLTGELISQETDESLNVLLKFATFPQLEMFPREIGALKTSKSISRKSNLLALNPFLDNKGLLRVDGRLSKANLPYASKHQIILAPKHPLTRLIILNEHHKRLRAGLLSILSALREKYWVIHGRREIRSVLKSCITCFRISPKAMSQQMGNLPIDRVSQNRPFYISGVDFAGPFLIKDGKLRNRATVKAYLCIFICFTTKAVHLETVGDLSSQAFLNALKRFVSRRGLCKTLYSDNATNFTGANNELKGICNSISKFKDNNDISNFLVENSISWNFIPPRSPHHGGLWEAAVKRAKYHITRVIGKRQLTFEQISTLFTQVEAIINSAPITPLSEDPADFSCLTPGHFLIGQPLLSIPERDLVDVPSNRLNQYQEVQQMYQVFWHHWSREYLLNLQQRSKWKSNINIPMKVGALVLLMDDNLPPFYWKMGRILQVHAGGDGIVRVVTVRTTSGVTTRAVQKLCLFPLEAADY